MGSSGPPCVYECTQKLKGVSLKWFTPENFGIIWESENIMTRIDYKILTLKNKSMNHNDSKQKM